MLPGPPLFGAHPCALTGTVVGGRYEILGSLARGGMAEVFLAKQTGFDGFEKLVAVKTIAGRHADDEYFVAMFLDEARTAADLRHPNVVQTYEVGVDGDTYFIAMEFLQGLSLARIQQSLDESGRSAPLDVAVQIIREAAAGLHHAHKKTDLQGKPLGIVHRDVSPQNVLVTVDGVTKIVDFGIALANQRSIVTSTGGLKGKYPYMSPEQARGENIDARSDLFALGVMLWELTVRRTLFRRDNEIQTLDAVRGCEVPKPSSLVADYPRVLEDAVLALLDKDPDARPADGARVVAMLEHVELQLGFTPRTSKLASFLEDASTERSQDPLARMANAPTALGSASLRSGPAVAVRPATSPSATLTFGASPKKNRRGLFAAAALGVAALVVGVAIAVPEGRAPQPADAGVARAGDAGAIVMAAAPAGVVDAGADQGTVAGASGAGAGDAAVTDAAGIGAAVVDAGRKARGHEHHAKHRAPVPPRVVDAGTAPAGFGVLRFTDGNPYYEVHLDGRDVGPTPRFIKHVPAGTHRVQLLAADTGAVVLDRSVEIQADRTQTVSAR